MLTATGICNLQKTNKETWKTIQMCLNWWNNLSTAHPYSGMLLSNKKATNNWSHNSLDESMLSERVHKGYTLCDSICMAFWKMENYGKLISGCQGLSSGEVLDCRRGSRRQNFSSRRNAEPLKVHLQDSVAFTLANMSINSWGQDWREKGGKKQYVSSHSEEAWK